MSRDMWVINLLGFWLMFVLILYVGLVFRFWAIRTRFKDGYLSYRRYRAFRRSLGRTCWKLLLLSVLITTILGGIIFGFNPAQPT